MRFWMFRLCQCLLAIEPHSLLWALALLHRPGRQLHARHKRILRLPLALDSVGEVRHVDRVVDTALHWRPGAPRDRARERSAVASRAHTSHLRSDGRRR